MSEPRVQPDPAFALLDLYETVLPQVYGYLLARCGDRVLAEELTSETFLGAVRACRKPAAPRVGVAWLTGVACTSSSITGGAGNGRNAGCARCTSRSPRSPTRGTRNWTRCWRGRYWWNSARTTVRR